MSVKAILLLTGLSLLPATALAAAGRAGGVLLQEPFGARAFSLGQAYSALGDDVYAMSYNPAILSRLKESQAATQFIQSLGDTRLGYLGLASPLSPRQALGLEIAYLDAGKIDVFDDNGNPVSSLNAQRDFLIQTGYARSLDWGAGRLHAGALAKLLKSTLVEDSQTTAFAADLGGLYEIPWRRGVASAGLAVANLGPPAGYSGGIAAGARDHLPTTTRFSLSYAKEVLPTDTLGLGIEADRVFYNNQLFESVGLEYDYHRLFSLRLGYRLGADLGNLSMGVGFRVGGVSVDYAIALMQTFNNLQQVSLTYRFTVPGIRYGVQYGAGPTPVEALSESVEADIAERRYFDARANLDRLETFFPGTPQGGTLKNKIAADIHAMVREGPGGRRYDYALGFENYQKGNLREAMLDLQSGFNKEPNNREIIAYLDKARKKYQDIQSQLQLKKEARIGVLFDLANQAYEDGDYPRAWRIADEILRLGPYRPAEGLKRKIAEASRRPPAPRVRPPVVARRGPAARPAAQPRPSLEDVQKAESLYWQGVRDYSDNDVDGALARLREALRLDPSNATIKTALEHIEKMLEQKQHEPQG